MVIAKLTAMKIINENKATDEITRVKKLNKKHSKEKGWGWFVHPKGTYENPNAGNVEYNNAVFNSTMGVTADGGVGGVAVAEDINLNESHLAPIPENYEIIETEEFKRNWKKQKLNDIDLQKLKAELKKEPAEASLGSCLYKFRFSPSNSSRGQSSQDRIIYMQVDKEGICYLLGLFDKDKKDNLTPTELKYLRYISKILRGKK